MTAAGEILGVLEGEPLSVVELDSEDDLSEPLPPTLPSVVVGIARRPPSDAAPAGVDVALCVPSGEVPPGWVAASEPDTELGRIAANTDRCPQAAVLLAQILRTGVALSTSEGLLVESLAYSVLQSGPEFRSWLTSRSKRDKKKGPPSGSSDAVLVERRDDLLEIVLNRPNVRNALNVEMRDGLVEAIGVARADLSIERIELTGAGSDFSAGGDLEEFGSSENPVTGHFVRTARSPAGSMASVSDRVTARLHGACIGAGIELASFAGKVTARADTRIQLPEVTFGLLPGSGGTVSIPRRIGRHRTAWLCLGAAVVDAATAADWGLVDEVV